MGNSWEGEHSETLAAHNNYLAAHKGKAPVLLSVVVAAVSSKYFIGAATGGIFVLFIFFFFLMLPPLLKKQKKKKTKAPCQTIYYLTHETAQENFHCLQQD